MCTPSLENVEPQLAEAEKMLEKRFGHKIPILSIYLTQKNLLLNSDALVYCKDCGLVFYYGSATPILETTKYYEFKMLAFRHVWDTQHTVKIALAYFKSAPFSMKAMGAPQFDENNEINYSEKVEELREQLRWKGSIKVQNTFDENWDERSKAFCVTCGKEYHDPKDACYCCIGTKPWLPMKEVETLRVTK
jgi:hypothetical protein